MNTVRDRSGGHTTQDPLTVFFYLLLRDEVPAGVVERLVQEVEATPPGEVVHLSNGWLGRMAQDYASRVTGLLVVPKGPLP